MCVRVTAIAIFALQAEVVGGDEQLGQDRDGLHACAGIRECNHLPKL